MKRYYFCNLKDRKHFLIKKRGWAQELEREGEVSSRFCVRSSYRQYGGSGRRVYAGDYSNPVVSDESECVVLMLLPFHHLCGRSIHPSALPAPGPTSPRAPRQAMPSRRI